MARDERTTLTVLSVAVLEPEDSRCCDIRSVYWNGVQRGLAADELADAERILGAECGAGFAIACGESLAAVVAREAEGRGCDVVVLPGPRNRLVARLPRRLPRAVRRRTRSAVVEAP
jgi:hypothetical protein